MDELRRKYKKKVGGGEGKNSHVIENRTGKST